MSDMIADQSETRLLERARSGDSAAFDRLFKRYRAELRRFVDLRLDPRVRQRVDASDIVQDTHVEAFRRFDSYYDRRPMPFSIWLRKNAYERLLNVHRDHLNAARRSVGREQRLPERSSVMLVQFLKGQGSSPSEALLKKEFRQRVTDAVAQLAPADREVLLMRNVEGLSHQEIAYLLDISAPAARKRYARALLRLEQVLVASEVVD